MEGGASVAQARASGRLATLARALPRRDLVFRLRRFAPLSAVAALVCVLAVTLVLHTGCVRAARQPPLVARPPAAGVGTHAGGEGDGPAASPLRPQLIPGELDPFLRIRLEIERVRGVLDAYNGCRRMQESDAREVFDLLERQAVPILDTDQYYMAPLLADGLSTLAGVVERVAYECNEVSSPAVGKGP